MIPDPGTVIPDPIYLVTTLDIPFCKVISSRAASEPTQVAPNSEILQGSISVTMIIIASWIKSSVLILAAAANGFIYKDPLSSLLQPPADQPKHCKQLPEKQTSLHTLSILLWPPCWISRHEYFASFRYPFLSPAQKYCFLIWLVLSNLKQVQSV